MFSAAQPPIIATLFDAVDCCSCDDDDAVVAGVHPRNDTVAGTNADDDDNNGEARSINDCFLIAVPISNYVASYNAFMSAQPSLPRPGTYEDVVGVDDDDDAVDDKTTHLECESSVEPSPPPPPSPNQPNNICVLLIRHKLSFDSMVRIDDIHTHLAMHQLCWYNHHV